VASAGIRERTGRPVPGRQEKAPSRPSPVRGGWPLTILFVAFPLWWALGLGAFIWFLVAVPLAAGLFMRGRVRVPRGFGVWLLFLMWMLISGTQVDEPQRWIVFAYRAAIYVSATLLFLYVFNAPEDRLPTGRVVGTVTWFWAAVVVAGVAALVAPELEFTSPMEAVLPGSVAGNQFVQELVHPRLAQVQGFLGYPVARPTAPFAYTNEWAANLALLTPFVFAAFSTVRSAPRRGLLIALLVLSVVPAMVSLNRGLWLSLTLALLYGAGRLALRGRMTALRAILALGVVTAVLLVATPLGGLVADRIATPHSNEGRLSLYTEAAEGAMESPLLGYGSPRPSEQDPNLPRVGTHGQLWLILYSHGIPAVLFFLAWFLYAFWITRRPADRIGLWMHVVLFVALVQLAYYGMLPVPIHITMVAAAVALRTAQAGSGPESRPPAENMVVPA
jgi:polysaccharide biosynthesis protein PslJ